MPPQHSKLYVTLILIACFYLEHVSSLEVAPGYWLTIREEWAARGIDVNASNVEPLVACPLPAVCAGNQTCVTGYTGWACTFCIDGWAKRSNGRCINCVTSAVHIFVVIIAAVGCAIFAPFLIKRAMKRRSKLVIVARMFVNFLQMTATLRLYLSYSEAPPVTKDAIKLSNAANFVSFDAPSFQCTMHSNFFYKYGLYMALVPAAVVVPYVGLSCYVVLAERWRWMGLKLLSWRKVRQITATSTGVLLFFLHNTISANILRTWDCTSRSVGGYLRTSPDVSCNSPSFRLLQTVVSPIFLVLYGFGIPVIGFIVLWRQRNYLTSPRMLKYYGFSYDGYKPSIFWWECFIMIRKLGFVAVGILINDEQLQLVTGLFLLVIVLGLHLYLKPYEEGFLNALEGVALSGNLILYIGILVNTMAKQRSNIMLQDAMGYAIISTNACVVFFFVVAFALALKQQAIVAAKQMMRTDKKGHETNYTVRTLQMNDQNGFTNLSRAQRAVRHGALVVAHHQIQQQRHQTHALMSKYNFGVNREKNVAAANGISLTDLLAKLGTSSNSLLVDGSVTPRINGVSGGSTRPLSLAISDSRQSVHSMEQRPRTPQPQHRRVRSDMSRIDDISAAVDESEPRLLDMLPSWLGGGRSSKPKEESSGSMSLSSSARPSLAGRPLSAMRPSSRRIDTGSPAPEPFRRASVASTEKPGSTRWLTNRSKVRSGQLEESTIDSASGVRSQEQVSGLASRFSVRDPFNLDELAAEILAAAGAENDRNSIIGISDDELASPRAGKVVRNPLSTAYDHRARRPSHLERERSVRRIISAIEGADAPHAIEVESRDSRAPPRSQPRPSMIPSFVTGFSNMLQSMMPTTPTQGQQRSRRQTGYTRRLISQRNMIPEDASTEVTENPMVGIATTGSARSSSQSARVNLAPTFLASMQHAHSRSGRALVRSVSRTGGLAHNG